MNRYWDLTEKQRAELTEEQVRSFLDVDLMEQGVAKVRPPTLHVVVEPEIPLKAYARIKSPGRYNHDEIWDVAFADLNTAKAFLELKPLVVANDWETGKSSVRPIAGASVFLEELASIEDVTAAVVILKANKAKREENAKAENVFREAMKKVDEATRGVWDDWHDCRAKAARAKRVAETREEYRRLAGTEELAETFLVKALGADLVEFEREWAQ